jgi:hypothetical protein
VKQVTRGSAVRWKGTFKVDGTLTDPTTVTLQILGPGGGETTYTYAGGDITRESLGVFHYDRILDDEGVWKGYMVGTGDCRAAEIVPVQVKRDAF